jgi:thiol-disulfide isomerase/thioredoxin
MLPASHSPRPALVVACLCAQWCGTCGSYRSVFAQLEAEFPDCRFVWIDVEDQADVVDPIEVENFPTLLIAAGAQALFFGTVTPHVDTARRLIQAQLALGATTAVPAALTHEVNQLLIRLH